MGAKYIRNTDDATIVCKIPSDKNKVFIFKPKKFDKRNNIILSNGFTEVTEEDLKLLEEESSTFQYFSKSGKLSLTDDLPEEAMSPEQLINSLREENEKLKAQIADGNAGKGSDGDLAEVQRALQNALASLEEKDKMIEALDEQLASMQEELNAADSAKDEALKQEKE